MATDPDKDIEIDPRFFIPPGLIDVRQSNKQNSEYIYDDSTRAVEGPILETPTSVVPIAPTSYSIVSQRVRTSSDGRAVVDVLVEFPDIPGVQSIDIQITKA